MICPPMSPSVASLIVLVLFFSLLIGGYGGHSGSGSGRDSGKGGGGGGGVEEFHVFEPMELHDAAVDRLIKMRRADPKLSIEKDSPFMQEARLEAVKRYRMKAPAEIKTKASRLLLSIGLAGDATNSLALGGT